MKLRVGVLIILVCVALYIFSDQILMFKLADSPQLNLPRTTLTTQEHVITAQLAETPMQRNIGLMFRHAMPLNEGMLFAFEKAAIQCFWMKNTLLPLSIAFIADDGTISNLANMEPRSTEQHCATMPVRFALEMNQGWFAQNHVDAGDVIQSHLFAVTPE
jgi:uncharacterized membrane protein (UPF0127 family)